MSETFYASGAATLSTRFLTPFPSLKLVPFGTHLFDMDRVASLFAQLRRLSSYPSGSFGAGNLFCGA
jgi:hypothetical protein